MIQYWLNVVPSFMTLATLDQHCVSVSFCWFIALRPVYSWTDAGIMLTQCYKRRATISLTLCQRLEFANWL